MTNDIVVFWFRRDLRIDDNTAFCHALQSGLPVLPVFIFDTEIISELKSDDRRISFIYDTLSGINKTLKTYGSSLSLFKGKPEVIFNKLSSSYHLKAVYSNRDYEPYAISRDEKIKEQLEEKGIAFYQYKDQVIFEKDEIIKSDGNPYTVYTHYKNQWLKEFIKRPVEIIEVKTLLTKLLRYEVRFPDLSELGYKKSGLNVVDFRLDILNNYAENRDIPSRDGTSYLGPHLRFGTISIRQIINQLKKEDEAFLGELIWREFFMQILFHFPRVVNQNFKIKYNDIPWRNNEKEFILWCNGETGYPMVDAGMRQLNETGYMHNRVRMVVASFLCKHLLIDWRWGEAYFAEKLLDFELSSNNGNWQWAAGTGCDAAPYFRVFNPSIQQKIFDPKLAYIRKWVKDFDGISYPQPVVEHEAARIRAIETYGKGIKKD